MTDFPKPYFIISKPNFSLVWFGTTNQFLVVHEALEVFFTESLVQTESEYQGALEEVRTSFIIKYARVVINVSQLD